MKRLIGRTITAAYLSQDKFCLIFTDINGMQHNCTTDANSDNTVHIGRISGADVFDSPATITDVTVTDYVKLGAHRFIDYTAQCFYNIDTDRGQMVIELVDSCNKLTQGKLVYCGMSKPYLFKCDKLQVPA